MGRKRKLICAAADQFLTEQKEGDGFDAYTLLTEVSNDGRGNDFANLYVNLWNNVERESVDVIIDLIDDCVNSFEYADVESKHLKAFKLINDIDWKLLKEQKTDLYFTLTSAEHGPSESTMDGIFCLLDALQDYAVEVLNIPEDVVFDKAVDEIIEINKKGPEGMPKQTVRENHYIEVVVEF